MARQLRLPFLKKCIKIFVQCMLHVLVADLSRTIRLRDIFLAKFDILKGLLENPAEEHFSNSQYHLGEYIFVILFFNSNLAID